ncbi:hypothetical protein L3Q82_022843, partial [Scortum barcoo]
VFKDQSEHQSQEVLAELKDVHFRWKRAEKLEGYYSTDTRRMWQGLQLVTDYKGTTVGISNNSTSLPDEFNQFYCRFDTHNRETEKTHEHTWDRHDPPPSVSSADVHRALRRVNPRKAQPAQITSPGGRVLRLCASELADVFTSIFNLSLMQATVPTCFKSTSIIPVPKRSPVATLNDYRPVALTPIILKCFERTPHLQHWTPSNMPTAPTDPLKMQYLQHCTRPSPTLKIRTHTSRCSLLTTVQHLIQSFPTNSQPNCFTWASTPLSATGYWTFSLAGRSLSGLEAWCLAE